MNIQNNFSTSGTEEASFISLMRDITAATKTVKFDSRSAEILVHCPIKEYSQDGKTPFYILSQQDLLNFKNGKKLRIGNISNETFPDWAMDELKKGGFLAITGKNKYIISEIAVSTMSRTAGVTGEYVAQSRDILRALFFIDGFYTKGQSNTYLVRNEGNINKIFACLGRNYKLVSHNIFLRTLDIIKDNGGQLTSYYFDHNFTRVCYTLPGREGFDRGIEIISSDTGKSSIIIKNLAIYKGSKILLSETSHVHDDEINEEDIMDKISDTLCNPKYLAKDFSDFLNAIKTIPDSRIQCNRAKSIITSMLSSCVPKKHREKYAEKIVTGPMNKKEFCLAAFTIPKMMAEEEMPVLYIQGTEKIIKNILTLI